MKLTIPDIAVLCHTANRKYCELIGDPVSAEWDKTTENDRNGYMLGVQFFIDNPQAGPGAMHSAWLKTKTQQGWRHGAVKDEQHKTHPSFLPFDKLEPSARVKDAIFIGIVKACL